MMSGDGSEPRPSSGWQGVGATVRGSSHERSGTPNQDAFTLYSDTDPPVQIAVVADGHGSPKSFRSDRGARFAVQTARETLHATVARIPPDQTDAVIEAELREHLPRDLHKAWADAVDADLEHEPFTSDEQQTLVTKQGEAAADTVRANPRLAYGATLLAFVATPRFLLFAQLGDGDILLAENGKVIRAIPKDPRLIANETTSLCTPEAWNEVVVFYLPLTPPVPPPDLVLLATDGYGNSYANDADFYRVAADLHARIAARGLGAVAEKLPGWLDATSRGGSGDDITACLLVPDAARGEAEPAPSSDTNFPDPPTGDTEAAPTDVAHAVADAPDLPL